jgi:hypothetical protein
MDQGHAYLLEQILGVLSMIVGSTALGIGSWALKEVIQQGKCIAAYKVVVDQVAGIDADRVGLLQSMARNDEAHLEILRRLEGIEAQLRTRT